MERKLLTYERVQGLVFGAFGKASEDVHTLIDQLATSRVRVAGPQRGINGTERSVEGESVGCGTVAAQTVRCGSEGSE